MAKTRQQKEQAVFALLEGIKEAKSSVFADLQGLKVTETDALRKQCKAEGITYLTSKKTLIKRALSDVGINADIKSFEGGIAALFGRTDEITAPKIVAEFAKTHEAVRIFGGILEGAFIDAAKVKALASLPTRDQLYAKLVGSMNAPISGFVRVLAGNLRGLVTALNQIREKKVA